MSHWIGGNQHGSLLRAPHGPETNSVALCRAGLIDNPPGDLGARVAEISTSDNRHATFGIDCFCPL
jgi:hypothetical protein